MHEFNNWYNSELDSNATLTEMARQKAVENEHPELLEAEE
jgi:hypothetical protein